MGTDLLTSRSLKRSIGTGLGLVLTGTLPLATGAAAVKANTAASPPAQRSEERRVGKECVP